MKNLSLLPGLVFAMAILISGCSNKVFHANTFAEVDYDKFSTFAFLPNPDTTEYDLYDSEIIHYRSLVEVRDEMNRRGYRLDTASPDLIVAIRPMMRDISENPYNNLPDNYAGPGIMMYHRGLTRIPDYPFQEIEYARGVLVLDIFENGSLQLIYRAWSDAVINANPSPEELDNYIARLFNKYPVLPD